MNDTTNINANIEPDEKRLEIPSIVQLDMRDYFAAKIMAALIAEPQWGSGEQSVTEKVIGANVPRDMKAEQVFARVAYVIADAMLTERDKS